MARSKARGVGMEDVRRDAYAVEELIDRSHILRALETRRAYAAYAIGQLDDRYFDLVRCYQAKGSTGQAVLLFSSAGLGNAVFALGDSGALTAILRLHRGPRHNYATCQPEHLHAFRRFFTFAQEQSMLRMAVTADSFQPVADVPAGAVVRRLRPSDVRSLNVLYSAEGVPAYYSATHLRDGCYFGVYEHGRLVSVAGTHVISEQWSIAVVGNVFTHPLHRGAGYAELATSATTAELLQRCRDVVLTVDPDNTPAVRAYRRLGYREECRLIEAAVVRKDPFGIGSLLARALARFRGRRQGTDLVLG
jgi:RimJ/RimL family protein N-acetyltransferase